MENNRKFVKQFLLIMISNWNECPLNSIEYVDYRNPRVLLDARQLQNIARIFNHFHQIGFTDCCEWDLIYCGWIRCSSLSSLNDIQGEHVSNVGCVFWSVIITHYNVYDDSLDTLYVMCFVYSLSIAQLAYSKSTVQRVGHFVCFRKHRN